MVRWSCVWITQFYVQQKVQSDFFGGKAKRKISLISSGGVSGGFWLKFYFIVRWTRGAFSMTFVCVKKKEDGEGGKHLECGVYILFYGI